MIEHCAHVAPVIIEDLSASTYVIPTDSAEADGTLAWDSTAMVIVEAHAGGLCGLGYTYAGPAAGVLIRQKLAEVVQGRDAMAVSGAWSAMIGAVRNLGRSGLAAMAISAVDSALWDLKAKLLGLPLVSLLGQVHDAAPVYGSGGFTSYSIERLQEQLAGWADQGIPRVKMKVGTHPDDDRERVRAAREAVGPKIDLYVDANGAFHRKQALALAESFADLGVSWFEEPVSSDDLEGLRLMRDRSPSGMEIAAGEYGFDLIYFHRMLREQAVDVLQADATRCAGITGFLQIASLCQAQGLELSAHCAPGLHVHPGCAIQPLRHLEFFHDHVRIEEMFFDGFLQPYQGVVRPDLSRPGSGLDFKRQDAEPFEVAG